MTDALDVDLIHMLKMERDVQLTIAEQHTIKYLQSKDSAKFAQHTQDHNQQPDWLQEVKSADPITSS